MKKEDLVGMGVSEELAEKIIKQYGDMVPRTRLNEETAKVHELKNDISKRDEQLKDLAKITKDNEELNSKIKELQEINKNAQTEYESKLASLRLDNGIELALTQGGALNNKAVKALLNMENIKYEGDTLKGLDEQLKALRESDAYLFKGEGKNERTLPNGFNPSNAGDKISQNTTGFKSYEQILSEIN